MRAVNVRDGTAAGPGRGRLHEHELAALLPTRSIGGADGAFGTARQLRTAAQASCGRPRLPRWSAFPALALLTLLSCWGPAVDAAYDPVVEAVQEALTERGFEPGKIDGAIGSRTRNALREFQRSVGLPSTGEIDAATIAALGLGPPDTGRTPPAGASPPTPAAGSGTAPDAGLSGAEAPRAAPQGEPARAEPPRVVPAAKPAPKPVLTFATLGWLPPETGADALERFVAIGAPRDFGPGADSLLVPKPELVFVLHAGERVPGLDCDPGAGRLSVEFVFGPDGPAIFTPVGGAELCRMAIGIALEVGRTLEIQPIDWDDVRYPQGTVRLTREGLQYID